MPIQKIQQLMETSDMDAIVCRLPENVLFLSHYWPVSGFCFVICPKEGEPVLLAVDLEQEYMIKNRIKDVRYFSWGTLAAGNPYDRVAELLREVTNDYQLSGKKIGFEGSFETIAPPLNSGEPGIPAAQTQKMLKTCFGVTELFDATDMLYEARVIKTDEVQQQLKIAHEIAEFGLQVFVDSLAKGKTEAEVSAVIEAEISRSGHGYKGVQHVRAWAQLMTGERTSRACSPFPATTHKTIQSGDLAVLELAVVADGYWADLTRTRAVNSATDAQLKAYQAILDAHKNVKGMLKAGISESQVDAAARQIIVDSGFGNQFVHITGHGLGFKYHEPTPLLHPNSHRKLKQGMVTSIEPGIYVPGEWGMRVEENVVIQQGEPIYLSTFATELL